jgi:hypothetical protein
LTIKTKIQSSSGNALTIYGIFVFLYFIGFSEHYIFDSAVAIRDIFNPNSHGTPLAFLYDHLARTFGEIDAVLILAAIVCVSTGTIVSAQLAAMGIGLMVGFSRLPKFSTYLIGSIVVTVLFYTIWVWVFPFAIDLVTTQVVWTKFTIYVLASIKLALLIKFLLWFKQYKSILFLPPLFLLWLALIGSATYLAHKFLEGDYSDLVFLVATSFLACPMVMVLYTFPVLQRHRSS